METRELEVVTEERTENTASCDVCGQPRPAYVACSYQCPNCGYYQDCSDRW